MAGDHAPLDDSYITPARFVEARGHHSACQRICTGGHDYIPLGLHMVMPCTFRGSQIYTLKKSYLTNCSEQ